MKKHVSAIIAAILTASLFAAGCGGSSSQDAGSGGSASAQTVATEASETEGAQQSPETETPDTVVPEDASDAAEAETEDNYTMQKVEITPDNWQDYFEIVFAESPVVYTTTAAVPDDSIDYYMYELRLKEEYAQGFKEHGTYTLPDRDRIHGEEIEILLATEEVAVENYPDVTYTYTITATPDFCDFAGWIEKNYTGELVSESGVGVNAIVRYLMASNGMFEEPYNDYFSSCFNLLSIFSKQKDDAAYARYDVNKENLEQWQSENVEVEITDIHGTVPVWVKE